MRKILITFLPLLLLILKPGVAHAADCSSLGISVGFPSQLKQNIDNSITFTASGLQPNSQYDLEIFANIFMGTIFLQQSGVSNNNGELTFTFTEDDAIRRRSFPPDEGWRQISIDKPGLGQKCSAGLYQIVDAPSSCQPTVTYSPAYSPLCVDSNSTIAIDVINAIWKGNLYSGNAVISVTDKANISVTFSNGKLVNPATIGGFQGGKTHTVTRITNPAFGGGTICELSIPIAVFESCQNYQIEAGTPHRAMLNLQPGATTPACDTGRDASGNLITGTPTALGCIPNEPVEAIKLILPWAIRLGTGLAFLLFLYGAFTLITAGSDPQKVDTGKSIITSAAAGLIFIILSVILLRVIGIDILKL